MVLKDNLNVFGKIKKYQNFSVPIKKEIIEIIKDDNKSV